MARKQKLKLFKTPIGFHDAYVAAPSRKAALEAWGAGSDLFGAGIAEEVKDGAADTKVAKAALASPGEIVRVARQAQKEASAAGAKAQPAKRKQPRPSRATLEKAEAALTRLEETQATERAALAKEEEKLAKRRRALEDKQAKAREKAETKRDAAEERYRRAMADWVG